MSRLGTIMRQIRVRNLDESAIERLRVRARSQGRSLEREVQTILTEATKRSRVDIAHDLEGLRAQQRAGSVSVVDLIRDDRDR